MKNPFTKNNYRLLSTWNLCNAIHAVEKLATATANKNPFCIWYLDNMCAIPYLLYTVKKKMHVKNRILDL